MNTWQQSTDNKTHATTQRGHVITKSLVQKGSLLSRSVLFTNAAPLLPVLFDENNVVLFLQCCWWKRQCSVLQYHLMETILHLSYNIPWWKQYHVVLTTPLDENNTALVLQRRLMETLLHCSHDALEWQLDFSFNPSLSLAWKLGHHTWVRRSSHKSSATHSCQCVKNFPVSKQWYGCQCLGLLMCAQMLIHAIVQGGCMDTVRETA